MNRPASAAIGVLAVCAVVAAPAASAKQQTRYSLVHGCYALAPAGGSQFFAKSGGGYVANAGSAGAGERFRMQATDLGRYLFYGTAKDFMAVSGGSGIAPANAPSNSSDWTVKSAGNGVFTVTNTFVGKDLAVNGSGKLVAVDAGSAGSAGQFRFTKAGGCPDYPEIDPGVTGKPYRSSPSYGETKGYIDGHMHLMAYEFLGGDAHCGRPWHRFGVEYALVDCIDHTATNGCGAILEQAVGGDTCHDPGGWPGFKGWPKNYSLTHEGTYYRWLERAWRGGQRIFVNLLVENRVLCELYPIKHNSCNEMDSVLLQAKRMHELEDYIDAQSGGPGKGWFRVVRNPFEARRVINKGKLAMVMGMEVSEPFNCTIYNGVPQCGAEDINFWLDRLRKLGVRQLEITNKFDNALTGVAGDGGSTGVLTNSGNRQSTGRYWDLEHCDDGDTGNHDRSPTAVEHNDDAIIGNGLEALLPPGLLPVYPPPPHCNKLGLTALGRHAIKRIMAEKLIFDPDHMSLYGRDAAMDVIESKDYPGVFSSHSWSTPNVVPRIYGQGGVITPYAGGSEGFVHKWEDLRPQRTGRQYWGFGYGADMNGLGGQGGPRGLDTGNAVAYPFKSWDGGSTIHQQRSGTKDFNINTDGVAMYGMYPDWIEDLRKLAGGKIIKDMVRGPEAYLQMWERAYGVPEVRCPNWRSDFSRRGLVKKLRLGDRSKRALYRAGQPVKRTRTWEWCARNKKANKRFIGGRRRVVGVFDDRDRLGLIASTLQRNNALDVGRGSSLGELRKISRPVGGGIYIRSIGKGRSYVWGAKRGKVRFSGLAGKRVTRNGRVLRKYVKRSGIF